MPKHYSIKKDSKTKTKAEEKKNKEEVNKTMKEKKIIKPDMKNLRRIYI